MGRPEIRPHTDYCRVCARRIDHREIINDTKAPTNGAGDPIKRYFDRPRFGVCAECARDAWQAELAEKKQRLSERNRGNYVETR